jgi:osmotically-inducible protein OsmY
MKRELVLFSAVACVLCACDQMERPSTPKPDRSKEVSWSDTDVNSNTSQSRLNQNASKDKGTSWFSETDSNAYDANNTGKNMRDRHSQALTAGQQPENEFDRTLAQKVRQAIVQDEILSTRSKNNIKVIVVEGKVTLRGPVLTPQEKAAIVSKIQQIEGIKNVDNQLEIVKDN